MSKTFRTVLMILVSIAILIGVVAWVGVDRTLEGLDRAGLTAFLALGAIQLGILVLQTMGWAVLNRPTKHRVSRRTLFEAGVVGTAVNVITPSAYLGGEPAKVLYVGRRTGLPYTGIAGTVVLAKYMEALSFFLLFTTSTVFALVTFRADIFSDEYLPVGLVLVVLGSVLLVVFIALILSLIHRGHPLTRLVGLISRVRPRARFFARLRNRTRRMENQVNELFAEHRQAAVKSSFIFLISQVLIFLRPAFFVLLTDGVWLNLGEIVLLAVASQALLAFQLTPGSVGTLDGGMLGVFSLLALQDSTCMALLLITRFWDTLIVGFGMVLGARVGAGMLAGRPKGEEVGLPGSEPAD
jgi:uncharacterized protein (TIRG00374 family)